MSAKEEVQRVNDQVIAAAAKGDFAPFVNVLADDVEVFDHVAYLFEGKGPFLEYLQIVTVGAEATTFALHQSSCRAISDTSLDDPRMTQVRAAVEVILKSNEPRSAVAHDRHWNVVMANRHSF